MEYTQMYGYTMNRDQFCISVLTITYCSVLIFLQNIRFLVLQKENGGKITSKYPLFDAANSQHIMILGKISI